MMFLVLVPGLLSLAIERLSSKNFHDLTIATRALYVGTGPTILTDIPMPPIGHVACPLAYVSIQRARYVPVGRSYQSFYVSGLVAAKELSKIIQK